MDKRLSEELGRIFTEEIQKVFDREIAEPDFMAHSAFPNSYFRAWAMIGMATVRVLNVLTMAIVKHREEAHQETLTVEREGLETQMEAEDVSIGLMSWWNR